MDFPNELVTMSNKLKKKLIKEIVLMRFSYQILNLLFIPECPFLSSQEKKKRFFLEINI